MRRTSAPPACAMNSSASLDPGQQASAVAMSRRPLLPWLMEIVDRPVIAQPVACPPAPPSVPPGGLYLAETGETLSPREVEVLRLLIGGASNPAIADTLIISRFTAKNHVASILQKLGVTTRTQAALRGRALGLDPLPRDSIPATFRHTTQRHRALVISTLISLLSVSSAL